MSGTLAPLATEAGQDVDEITIVGDGLSFAPTCDLAGNNEGDRCPRPGYAIVRFKAHDCDRDGKGLVACKECLDDLSSGHMICILCEGELFVVSTVKL